MPTLGERLRSSQKHANRIGFWLGIGLFLLILAFADFKPGNPLVTRMAAIAVLMATWWITDAIPLAATALLPLVLFPLLGILTGKETAPIYINSTIFVFIGGFLIALAMERWNLHKRIALNIIKTVGGGPSRLVLSFMLASAFLSMWISNTATAIMMLAIGLAIVQQQEAIFGKEKTKNLTLALLLGIAYGASVGGISTLVGTPPNLSLQRIFEITFPQAEPLSFGQWMLFGVPVSVTMLAIIWFLLTRVFFKSPGDLRVSSEVIHKEHDGLGTMKFEEKVVAVVFALTAVLWVFRKNLVLGGLTIPGWSNLVPTAKFLDDGTVAIAMALCLFLFPSRASDSPHRAVLDVDVFRKLPWHIVLLFGGGFALAKGFSVSGLSTFVGSGFSGLGDLPPLLVILCVCFTLTFLTELTSNTATTEMILPILASVAVAMKVHPLLLMVPATVSASCAFMMPVATPPNAIVFGSGRIEIRQMVRVGLVINLIAVFVVTILFYTIGRAVFGIEAGVVPEWAKTVTSEQ
ncbi:MAG: SLC13 family permease [Verrucomicrobiota bacterium]